MPLERFCAATWQTHARRRQRPAFKELWPTRETFKTEWPRIADLLIVSDWRIDGARTASAVTETAYDLLDPPPPPPRDWRTLYGPELGTNAGVAWDLAQENPLARVFKRAKLSPLEADAFRLYAVGDSVSSIARHLGRQKRTVETVLARAEFKLRVLRSSDPVEAVP